MIKAIVAMSLNRVIGTRGDLPWTLPEDMRRVSNLTRGHFVLMGRKTYFSVPERFRPLPDRVNLVLSKQEQLDLPDGVTSCATVEAALELYGLRRKPHQDLWIFGGEQIYRLTQSLWEEVYLTLVAKEIDGDTFFPVFEPEFDLVAEEEFRAGSFLTYRRRC